MFTKKDIEDLLSELDVNQSMVLHYGGFIGRGINGVSGNCTNIKNDMNIQPLVKFVDGYDDKIKIYLTHLDLRDNYLKASYMATKKAKYSNVYKPQDSYPTVVVPYDGITSIQIINLPEEA
ncbi:hypothetical protein [Romboutsia timonensis]|uniref:hypothetical protein n=1 Tax=Romboutsia timonensis TaxID=1776391 RepID=UPI0023F6DC59|nr:hypothetical protein [Romboutsia timonensis]